MIPAKLATLKSNGRRFLVQRLAIDKVYCRGAVKSVSGYSSSHQPDVVFKRDAVTISEVDRTPELLNDLLNEALNG
jgi:hypothetical protein